MLGRLITPLRAAFDIPQRVETTHTIISNLDEDAESFARDVRIELMRNSIEAFKNAEDLRAKIECMGEMHRIMVEDTCTKDVFRELDGFLLIVNVLSILHPHLEIELQALERTDNEQGKREEKLVSAGTSSMQTLEGERLAFTLLAESLSGHWVNQRYFESQVGYEFLGQALSALISDTHTVDQTSGFLLSLSLNNFALSSLFSTLRSRSASTNDTPSSPDLSEFTPLLGSIKHPRAFTLLNSLIEKHESVFNVDYSPRCVIYSLAEILISSNHRNHALLTSAGFLAPLLDRYQSFSQSATNASSTLATSSSSSTITPSRQERQTLQKLIKRLLEIGAPIDVARDLFKRAVREDEANRLDAEILDILRVGVKGKWPAHFSLEGMAAIKIKEDGVKGLSVNGFTFMIWLRVEKFPTSSHTLFTVSSKSRTIVQLSLHMDGALELSSAGNAETAFLEHAKVAKGRWTHLALVHYPHRGSNPSVRVFLDGVMAESRNWAYPKPELTATTLTYSVGKAGGSNTSWCVASAYLLSMPISDDLPRLIHHLSPRYIGLFQARDHVRMLTYESATALNIFLSGNLSKRTASLRPPSHGASMVGQQQSSALVKAIKDGLGIAEESFIFALTTSGYEETGEGLGEETLDGGKATGRYVTSLTSSGALEDSRRRSSAVIRGDVVVVRPQGLGDVIWKIGGCAISLRLIELSSTSHELSRTMSIFADSARMSWQMSEDMEHTRAFDVLAHILRKKAQLINVTTFEILFESMGINFKSPELSTIVNTLAYRSIALDFEIWVGTNPDIQRIHLDHFTTLLKTSRYKQFNAKQRISKFGAIRKLVFALQTDWYAQNVIPHVVAAIKVVAHASFSVDETVKPLVSYLAANLHDDPAAAMSPRSVLSRMDNSHTREKAEGVLEAFVSILSNPSHLSRFSAVLPLTRVLILLLGENPNATVAVQVLKIVGLAMKASASFARKYELVSGWTALKLTLPSAWNREVQETSFAVLFGCIGEKTFKGQNLTVACPHILPAVLTALDHSLNETNQTLFAESSESSSTASDAESLVDELMDFLSTSPSFRQLFKSQSTAAILINAYSSFVDLGNSMTHGKQNYLRVLEKMNHLAMSLTLGQTVSSTQRQELLNIRLRTDLIFNTLSNGTSPSPATLKRLNTPPVTQTNIQVLGERAYQRTIAKIREWRKNIVASERKRVRRTFMDLRELRRLAEHSDHWRNPLFDDRGLWTREISLRSWVLDETEGPCRVRKKLERKFDFSNDALADGGVDPSRIVEDPDVESIIHVEVPPWAESYGFGNGESDQQWIDEVAEDKHRRVRHELQPGDIIDAVCTVTRIVGVDSSPGLLILGRNNLYMLDGLVEQDDGEVVDVHDAPTNLFSVPGSLLELDSKQRAQYWTYDQVTAFSRKMCLFRDVALEVYFKDNRSLLIVCASKKRRQEIGDKLSDKIALRVHNDSRSPLLFRNPLIGKASARVMVNVRDELYTAQRKWQAREISNFTYLSILNQSSGRTPLDATQYPVFPWVLADYASDYLDLTSPATFRDFECPMGALTPERREAAIMRYSNLESVGEKPFHYGTHFSSSMIVCHFMIRLEPFTHMFKTLQGGDWDLPDRLFSDISRSYNSASQDLRGDVRELIPEFYTCPEFLVNSSNHDFGVQTNTGEEVHDVKLPPWAKNDPLLFITEHRRALESEFVSQRLPAWIDLIWGCKQRDASSLNVFHPLSYEGSIDLDAISDELEREATVGIIHNFGQTPRKLFDTPHPARIMQGSLTLPLGTSHGIEEDAHLLLQSSRPLADIEVPIDALAIDMASERVLPCPKNVQHVPNYPHEQIAWGSLDQSLRLIVDRKVTQVSEAVSCLCLAFVDSDHFVTGSGDFMVRQWSITRKDGTTKVTQKHLLRAHSGVVLSVATCRSWSLIVSGSEDGTVALWDLNRSIYVRSIRHEIGAAKGGMGNKGNAVYAVAVNASTGYIASCSSITLALHTINAHPIAALDLTLASPSDGRITSIVFHEREYSPRGVLATATDTGLIHLRTWNANETPVGEKAQWKFMNLRTLRSREDEYGISGSVTAVQFVGESLYHGDSTGKLYCWSLPD